MSVQGNSTVSAVDELRKIIALEQREIMVKNERLKDFEAVTRKNLELSEALEHIVATNLGGQNIVLKNKELHELVTTLQDDIAQRDYHIKELETTLASSGNDLAMKVNELTKEKLSLERSMKAKQIFSEKLLKENRMLKNETQVLNEMKEDIPDGRVEEKKEQRNADVDDAVKEEIEALKKALEDKEKTIAELEAEKQVLHEQISNAKKEAEMWKKSFEEEEKMLEAEKQERLSAQVTTLLAEVEKAREGKTKLESELSETAKKCADFQKKCAGLFKQVVSLNAKQQQSEEEIAALKRQIECLENLLKEERNRTEDVSGSQGSLEIAALVERNKNQEMEIAQKNAEILKMINALRTSEERCDQLEREMRRRNDSYMAFISSFESQLMILRGTARRLNAERENGQEGREEERRDRQDDNQPPLNIGQNYEL